MGKYLGSESSVQTLVALAQPTYLTLATDKDRVDICQFYTLSGKLVDAQQNPLVGKTVHLYGKTEPPTLLGTTVTGSDGSYSFSLHGTAQGLYVFYTQFEPVEIYDGSRSEEVQVGVALLSLVVTVVRKGTTTPVPDATVTYGHVFIDPISGKEGYVWIEGERQVTDENGQVTFFLQSDIYAVRVNATGFYEAIQSGINLTEDTAITVELEPVNPVGELLKVIAPIIVVFGTVAGLSYVVAKA